MAALNPAFLGVIFLAYFSCAWSFPGPDEPISDIYPYPRIVLLGPTGVGKSTLANVLAGCAPNDNTCFKTCSGTNSCTGNTTVNVVTYLGDDSLGEITLVDTPGFGETHASGDGPLIANMVDVLKNTLGEANIIVLCQEYGRFVPEIQTMILEMESLFGRDRIWNHVMLEVTKWSFSAENIFNRNLTGVTEEGALADINTSIMEISHLNQSLPGVFIDSYSQFYPDDEVQQQYFQDYTKQLWTLANNTETLGFYTIEDILEQLNECQTINDCLNDLLDERITNIEKSVDHNKDQISTLEGDVGLNTFNIDSHTDDIKDIKDDITSHTGDIKDIKYDITSHTDDIKDIKDDITSHTDDIKDIKDDIDSNTADITDIKGRLASQETRIAQCGYQSSMTDYTGPITYDGLLTNVATDHSILDTKTGTYRVRTTGQFVITFSALVRMDTAERAYIYLYRDGTQLADTVYLSSYHGNNYAYDQGSRTVVLSLTAGQEIQMRVDGNTAAIWHILFCIHLV